MSKFKIILVILMVTLSFGVMAASTKQIPTSIQCISGGGTGSGFCRVKFPSDFNNCPNKNMVSFNPESTVLGKEIYSMVLAAVTAKKELEVSYSDTNCPVSAAVIDWIIYSN